MYNLTTDRLQKSFDGHLWIKANRQKTITETNIRLLDTAKHIVEKYQGMAEGNKLLPVPCYGNCRHRIKAVAIYAESTRTSAGIKADTAMQLLFVYPTEYLLKRYQS